jgi:TetR/AcrR family transcriptional regulator
MQHHDLSRNQLLDAAEEMFGQKGFHDTTLREIADLAEFSVGSVYSFFESKEDLFRQIFLRRGEEFMPRIAKLLGGRGTPLELLHDLVDFEVGFFREHRQFGRLYLRFSSAAMQSPDRLADELVIDNYDESMRLQSELFARGQAEGLFCTGAPAVLARLFSGLVAAFQAVDPHVMSDDPDGTEHLSLEDFHALIDRTFSAR